MSTTPKTVLTTDIYLIGDLRLGGDLRLAGDRLSGGRGGLISQVKVVIFVFVFFPNISVLRHVFYSKMYLISQPAHSRGFSTTGPFRGRLWSGDRSGS